jgi:hypothetical protein
LGPGNNNALNAGDNFIDAPMPATSNNDFLQFRVDSGAGAAGTTIDEITLTCD